MFKLSFSYVVLIILVIVYDVHFYANAVISERTCTAARQLLVSKGIQSSDIQEHPINGSHLQICKGTMHMRDERLFQNTTSYGTCCSAAVEEKLSTLSRQNFEQSITEILSKLASTLETKAQTLNNFFNELLTSAKIDFHAMFRRTYGVIYEQNSYVFTDLFAELEKYYARGNVDLTEAMENFFNTLYQKMFTVLNSQYNFEDSYLRCVSEHMTDLKPFGDVPSKFSVQVKRAFIATRTYVRSLSTASDLIRNMLAIKPKKDCAHVLMQMQYCGICNSFLQKACGNFCINVAKDCLIVQVGLDSEWNNFVVAMEKVSERLIGPFNIEMVVGPIDIKISEAIMTFQENGHAVSQQIFEKCGHPKLGRWKRHVTTKKPSVLSIQHHYEQLINSDSDFEINVEEPSFNSREKKSATSRELELEHLYFPKSSSIMKSHVGGKQNSSRKYYTNKKSGEVKLPTDDRPNLAKIIKNIRTKVKDSTKFWSQLPHKICNNNEFALSNNKDNDCWNGTMIGRYYQSLMSKDTESLRKESEISINKSYTILEEQILSLRTLVANLRNAYNGLDVVWPEYEDAFDSSGSGSGSSFFPTHEGDTQQENISGNNNYDVDSVLIPDIYGEGSIPESPLNSNDLETKSTAIDDLRNMHTNILDRPDLNNLHYDNTSNNSSRKTEMTLSRALMGYLFPIFIMWFGEMLVQLM